MSQVPLYWNNPVQILEHMLSAKRCRRSVLGVRPKGGGCHMRAHWGASLRRGRNPHRILQ